MRTTPYFISKRFIEEYTDFVSLIALLEESFTNELIGAPKRHHYDIYNKSYLTPNTLLIMPAWSDNQDAGVKIVTVNPNNTRHNLPSVQGNYFYFDAITGEKKANIEATSLTTYRTAATSALASKFLSPKSKSNCWAIKK